MNGWIKLHRQITENKLWLSEKFTKAQAWVDLLLLANHDTNKFQIRGNWVTVERGQIGYANTTLAKRWKWSRDKVERFLKWLENESQIRQQKTPFITLIIVINYGKYQQNEAVDQATEKHQKSIRPGNRPGNRPGINKNDKNDKNVKKNIESGETPLTPAQEMRLFIDSKDKQEAIIEFLQNKGIPEQIARSELQKFFDYWTERNKSGTKERWETEKTFEIRRRLTTWFNNIKKFDKNKGIKITSI